MLVHITPGSKKNPSRQFDVSCSPCSTILRVLTKLGFNLPLGDKPMQKGVSCDLFHLIKYIFQPIQWDPEGVSMAQLEVNLTNFKNDVQQAFPGAIPIIFFVIPYKCTTYGVYSEYSKHSFFYFWVNFERIWSYKMVTVVSIRAIFDSVAR